MNQNRLTASGLPTRWFAPSYGMGSLGPAIFILTPQILLLFFHDGNFKHSPWCGRVRNSYS